MNKLFGIRFSPDAPAGGGTVTEDKPKVDPKLGVEVDTSQQKKDAPVLDYSTKVKGKDGKEYTVGDLLEAQGKLASAEKLQDAVKTLYSKDEPYATEEEFNKGAEALRVVRTTAGFDAKTIDAEIARLRAEHGFGEKGKGDRGADEEEDVIGKDPRIQQAMKLNASMVKRELEGVAEKAMQNADIKTALERVKEISGEEDYKALRASIMEDISGVLKREVSRRIKEAGGILEDIGWVAEAQKTAVETAVARHKPYFRTLKSLGKSSVVNEAFARLPEKPVEMPDPKRGQSQRDVQDNLEKWIEDTLMRGAHRVLDQGVPA